MKSEVYKKMEISLLNSPDKIYKQSSPDIINLVVTGDFCPKFRVTKLIEQGDYSKIFGDFVPFSRNADISITNLECPLTENETSINKKGPSLKAPVKSVDALKFAGFNLVSLANNHLMDQGEEGYYDTVSVLRDANIEFAGAGKNLKEALTPVIMEIKGTKIAVINVTEIEFSIAGDTRSGAAPMDEIENYFQIQKAKKEADFVLMIIHGGHEMYSLPSPRMVKTYRFFAHLGVDAIVGHHAHVYSGYEIFEGVPIFYNLGNFIFDRKKINQIEWHEGYAVNLTISTKGLDKISVIPYIQCLDDPGIHLLNDVEMTPFKHRLTRLNQKIQNDTDLKNSFSSFIKSHKRYYLTSFLQFGKIKKLLLKKNIFMKQILKRKKLIANLNFLRCQAHRDALIEVLKDEIKID